MTNVMVRAWEIAKGAVVKFGGKVKEYFAKALKQAWAEAKNAKQFGFAVVQKLNGMLYFAADANIEIAYYTQENSNRTGKPYTQRHVLTPSKTGTNKVTGKAVKIYAIELGMDSLDFGGAATLKINRGRLNWVA